MPTNYVTRAEWGARPTALHYQPLDQIHSVFVHHTVGDPGDDPYGYMRDIQSFHMDGRGWRDVAYNFVGDADTRTWFEGRGGLAVPGAQKGYNRGTVAICLMGDYRTKTFSLEDARWVGEFIGWIAGQRWAPALLTGGHRDAPNQTTTCPGDNIAARYDDIRHAIQGDEDMTQEEALEVLGLEKWHLNTLRALHDAFAEKKADVKNVQSQLVHYAQSKTFPGVSGGHTHRVTVDLD